MKSISNSVQSESLGIYLRDGNYANTAHYPAMHIYTPVEYTLYDAIQIVKLVTGYSDKYNWRVIFIRGQNETIANLAGKRIDEIKLMEFKSDSFYFIYGPIQINLNKLGGSRAKNQPQNYPIVYNRRGFFPTEDEYKNKVSIENMDKLFKKGELKDLQKTLKVFSKINTMNLINTNVLKI